MGLTQTRSQSEMSDFASLLKKVRIAVTWGCDYECAYCRPGGDGAKKNNHKQLSARVILNIAKLFSHTGCSQVNITGGEPTLRSDIGEVLDLILEHTALSVHLNTNGFRLPLLTQIVAARERLTIVASLDSATESISAKMGRPGAPQRVDRLLRFSADAGIRSRINCVLTRQTNSKEQIEGIIYFAHSRNVPIKLQTVFDTNDDSFESITSLYVDASVTRDTVRKLGFSLVGVSNISNGVAEEVWKDTRGFTVSILDKNSVTTVFTQSCLSCENYPCDTGMYAYYVDHGGFLNRCRTDRQIVCGLSQVPVNEGNVAALKIILSNMYGKKISNHSIRRHRRVGEDEPTFSFAKSPERARAKTIRIIPL